MTDEEKIDKLFNETYRQVAINHKEFCTDKWGNENFYKYDEYADRLISLGLVEYTDHEKIRICITEKGERIRKESSYLELVNQQKEKNQNERIKEEIRTELDKVNLLLAKSS